MLPIDTIAINQFQCPIENWQHWDWQHFHIGNIRKVHALPQLIFAVCEQLCQLRFVNISKSDQHQHFIAMATI